MENCASSARRCVGIEVWASNADQYEKDQDGGRPNELFEFVEPPRR